jgi:hypothetical protein
MLSTCTGLLTDVPPTTAAVGRIRDADLHVSPRDIGIGRHILNT